MCTSITLHAADGGVVSARTMEFGVPFDTEVYAQPAGTELNSTEPYVNNPGYKYTSKYGFIGMASSSRDTITDALNEAGLYIGVLYYPNYAVYEDETKTPPEKTVSAMMAAKEIAGSFATIAEVRAYLEDRHIVSGIHPVIQQKPPVHFIVTDKSGESILVEFDPDKVSIYNNEVRVMTNSPSYPWHLTNLRNYMNLAYTAVEPFKIDNYELVPFGQGSGNLGLPGDSYPPSRFVRAVSLLHSLSTPKTSGDAVFDAFHVLNNFDITRGSVVPHGTKPGDDRFADITAWTSAADTKTLKYYWKTYGGQRIECVDVKAVLAKVTAPTGIDSGASFTPFDRTDELVSA